MSLNLSLKQTTSNLDFFESPAYERDIRFVCNALTRDNIYKLVAHMQQSYVVDEVLPFTIECLIEVSVHDCIANVGANFLKSLNANIDIIYDTMSIYNVGGRSELYLKTYWNFFWALYFNGMLPKALDLYHIQFVKAISPESVMHCIQSFANIYACVDHSSTEVKDLFKQMQEEMVSFGAAAIKFHKGYIRANIIEALIAIAPEPEVYRQQIYV